MNSIKAFDAYSQLLDNNSDCNCFYYHRQEKLESRGWEFIKDYFSDGGKQNLITKEITFLSTNFLTMRCEHMRSLFLLGIFLL